MKAEEKIIGEIVSIFEELKHEKDLSPKNAKVNRNLSRLVEIASGDYDFYQVNRIMSDPKIESIRKPLLKICKFAECEMEKYFTQEYINESELNFDDLKKFLYFEHYKRLTDIEAGLIAKCPRNKIAFVGSGSLPLSPILMHKITNAFCHCIDCDYDACKKSCQLIKKLKMDGSIKVIRANAVDHDYSPYDIVFIASLAEPKSEILDKIKSYPNVKKIVIRSAEGMKLLLYEKVNEDEFKGFVIEDMTEPDKIVINTSLLLSKA